MIYFFEELSSPRDADKLKRPVYHYLLAKYGILYLYNIPLLKQNKHSHSMAHWNFPHNKFKCVKMRH